MSLPNTVALGSIAPRVVQTDDEKLILAEARLLGRAIIKKIVARNGLNAYWVVRPDGEVREFCYDENRGYGSNKGTMFSYAATFAGAGAKHDF